MTNSRREYLEHYTQFRQFPLKVSIKWHSIPEESPKKFNRHFFPVFPNETNLWYVIFIKFGKMTRISVEYGNVPSGGFLPALKISVWIHCCLTKHEHITLVIVGKRFQTTTTISTASRKQQIFFSLLFLLFITIIIIGSFL